MINKKTSEEIKENQDQIINEENLYDGLYANENSNKKSNEKERDIENIIKDKYISEKAESKIEKKTKTKPKKVNKKSKPNEKYYSNSSIEPKEEKPFGKKEFNPVKTQKNYFEDTKLDKIGSREFDEEEKIKNNPFRSIAKSSIESEINPKIRVSKPIEPLFRNSEIERLSKHQYPSNDKYESFYIKTKEIFPSQLGVEIPYKSKLKESLHNRRSLYGSSFGRKKCDSGENKFRIKKYENKSYFSYKSNMKRDNPFRGPSEYRLTIKQRKNKISEAVEKKEDELDKIAIIEDNIMSHKDLSEEEFNQLVNKFKQIMYNSEEVNAESKEELKGYEVKIYKITDIIKVMNNDDQNRVLNDLEKNADNEIKKEIFGKLKNNIEENNNMKKQKEASEKNKGEKKLLKKSLKK